VATGIWSLVLLLALAGTAVFARAAGLHRRDWIRRRSARR